MNKILNYIAVAALVVMMVSIVGSWLAPEPVILSRSSSTNYGRLAEEQFTITATGTAGAATGSATSDGYVRGHVYAVHLDYATGISNTTDITLTTNSTPSANLLILTDDYTDTWYYPAIQQTGSDGSGTSTYDRLPLNDRLSASVAQSTATSVVTVTVYFGD